MADATIVCRKCGQANPAGDQFCGMCGAFLEWEGTDEGPSAPSPTPDVPAPALPAAASVPIVPPPDAAPCLRCGSFNPPTRTFCQSCGVDLRPAAGARQGSAPAGSRPAAAGRDEGGRSWLPILLAVGLVAGVGIAVALVALRPKPIDPGASAAPTSALVPTEPPASAPPDASGTAPESVQLTITLANSSSVLRDAGPELAIDGNLGTAWVEAADEESGEWIELTFDPALIDYVVIYGGNQASPDAFRGNRRPENVVVTVNGGPPTAFYLADADQPQRLDVDDVADATTVRIQIVSTYAGEATAFSGSPTDDLAISEIRAYGR